MLLAIARDIIISSSSGISISSSSSSSSSSRGSLGVGGDFCGAISNIIIFNSKLSVIFN
jgi:hypothetical protein